MFEQHFQRIAPWIMFFHHQLFNGSLIWFWFFSSIRVSICFSMFNTIENSLIDNLMYIRFVCVFCPTFRLHCNCPELIVQMANHWKSEEPLIYVILNELISILLCEFGTNDYCYWPALSNSLFVFIILELTIIVGTLLWPHLMPCTWNKRYDGPIYTHTHTHGI